MAEEDVLLVAVRMDADGAITDTELLDNKFKQSKKVKKKLKTLMLQT